MQFLPDDRIGFDETWLEVRLAWRSAAGEAGASAFLRAPARNGSFELVGQFFAEVSIMAKSVVVYTQPG